MFGPRCTLKGELVDDEGVVVKTLGQVVELKDGLTKFCIMRDRGAGTKLRKGWSWLRNDKWLTKTFGDHKIFIQPKDDWTWQGK
eukprot:SAG11_NODE_2019_length_3914_cov_2.546908_5_plen_84_part_00